MPSTYDHIICRKYFAAPARSPHVPLNDVFATDQNDFQHESGREEFLFPEPDSQEVVPAAPALVQVPALKMTRAKGTGTTGARKRKLPPSSTVTSATTSSAASAGDTCSATTVGPRTRAAAALEPTAPPVPGLDTHLKHIFNGSPLICPFAQVVVQITHVGDQNEDEEYQLHVSDGTYWIPAFVHSSLSIHFQ